LKLVTPEIRAPFARRWARAWYTRDAESTLPARNSYTRRASTIYATFNPSRDGARCHREISIEGAASGDVQASATPQQRFGGALSFLDNVVNRSTGTIMARATISNPDHTLLPGEFVHVRVHIADQPDALLVPQVALGSGQLGRFVYVVARTATPSNALSRPRHLWQSDCHRQGRE